MLAICPDSFMRDYWQKKPCVLRAALPGFTDLLDENELAGLAMEPDLDSRIVRFHNNQWSVVQGPFEDFSACEGKWTLLVQGVDKLVDDASELMTMFNFIPNWRVDDLMISYAVEGAGVGPHVDQYDVFLVQGKGSRRWRVGSPQSSKATQPAAGLCQVEPFEPVIDCELTSGDILYIPPGWPHDGSTIESALTYSIGFRAPDQSQLAGYLAEHLQSADSDPLRYSDPSRAATEDSPCINTDEITQLKQLLHTAIDDNSFTFTLLKLLSDQGLEPDSDSALLPEQLQQHIDNDGLIHKRPGCRPILCDDYPGWCFVNGEPVKFSPDNHGVMRTLMAQSTVSRSDMASAPDKLDIFCTFTTLINMGYWDYN
ncbi:cupin domain-containing protein [Alteromonas gilva]|uniref:Cupin domain-containing protein n=1 Tax=Alteromonas gilva TaxID=2987522 RepID=A0ABT5L1C3_9ALTE|nr:cupin domain-containing protein [Alteromonas gilva]MDC8830835.1 cupin domain-containing protein [Alteromonas gilva]